MATAAFRDWVKAGRHWFAATPVTQYRTLLHVAGWPWEALGTIGDEAHLQAETPQDHCPFSVTGWPNPSPYPFVLALDVMHGPGNGRDVGPLVRYWVAEARAGHTPWVKYIVWRGQRWDVRNGWDPVPASGHYDHAHISFRTDYYQASIGTWNPLGGNDMSLSDMEAATLNGISERTAAIQGELAELRTQVASLSTGSVPAGLAATVDAIYGAVGELLGRPVGSVDPQALSHALADDEGFVRAIASAVITRIGPSIATEVAMVLRKTHLTVDES